VVDSWEDRDSDTERSGEKRAAVQEASKSVDNDEEVPAKRPKLVEVDEDSDDDFAAQLLEGQDRNFLKQIYIACKRRSLSFCCLSLPKIMSANVSQETISVT